MNPTESEIIIAIYDTRFDDLVELLKCPNIDINFTIEYDITPLHVAVYTLKYETVSLLLEHGANVNARESFSSHTPLHYAAMFDAWRIAEKLLEHGAEVDARDSKEACVMRQFTTGSRTSFAFIHTSSLPCCYTGRTPLHYAALFGKEIIQVLLKYKANINAQDANGFTPLFVATYRANLKGASFLIAQGASLHIRGPYHKTVLHYAVGTRNERIIHYIICHAPDLIYNRMFGGRTPFQVALDFRNLRAMVYLAFYMILRNYLNLHVEPSDWAPIERYVRLRVIRRDLDLMKNEFINVYTEFTFLDLVTNKIDETMQNADNVQSILALNPQDIRDKFPRYDWLINFYIDMVRDNFEKL